MNKILFAFTLCLPVTAHADAIYKWVDDAGEVHYTQTAPASRATKVNIGNVAPPTGSVTPGCVSYQCYADQLEGERHERERAYAKRDAEQARIEAEHKRQVAEAAAKAQRTHCKESPQASDCKHSDKAHKPRKSHPVQHVAKNR